jgi:hypothetical protein
VAGGAGTVGWSGFGVRGEVIVVGGLSEALCTE